MSRENLAKKVAAAEANLNLRITEELTLPEYLIAELLRLQVENTEMKPKLLFLELRAQTHFEAEAADRATIEKLERRDALNEKRFGMQEEAITKLEGQLKRAQGQRDSWRTKAKSK
jgi:hypothetical protein